MLGNPVNKKQQTDKGNLKLRGCDGSWMGDYATCGSCHLAIRASSTFAPAL